MPFKRILLIIILLGSITSCLKKPTLQKENYFPVGKSNLEKFCETINKNFPDYSCTEYFNTTYSTSHKEETLKITLRKKELQLFYKTDKKNGDLYEQYEALLQALKK